VAVTQIFVNLPVADVTTSKAFYEALGFSLNPQFTDEHTGCVVLGDNICAMIMEHDRFKDFTSEDIASSGIEVINAIGVESRDEVDRIADKALSSGGSETKPTTDMGWMYQRSFGDPDGHHWEATYVDEQAMAEAFAGEA
jgi:predicted lactoylglutathione lyase